MLDVRLVDRAADVRRLHWKRVYTGTEDDLPHDAVLTSAGTLCRVRVANDNRLYVQRIATPGELDNYGAWTDLRSAHADGGCAITASGSSIYLFYYGLGGGALRCSISTDDGLTYAESGVGSGVVQGQLSGPHERVAAATNTSGQVVLAYVIGTALYVRRLEASGWTGAQEWPHTALVGSVTGLDVTFRLDYNMVVTGTDAAGKAHMWTMLYGAGFSQSTNTFSDLWSLEAAEAGSGVRYQSATVDYSMGIHRIFYVQVYDGPQFYSRPYWTVNVNGQDFVENSWIEPVPFDLICNYGMKFVANNTQGFLFTPFGAWYAESPLSGAFTIINDLVLSAVHTAGPYSGGLDLVLRNEDGQFNDATLAPDGQGSLILGQDVLVRLGLRTGGRDVLATLGTYSIVSWEHRVEGGSATVLVHCADVWEKLAAWRAGRQFVWEAGTRNVFQILTELVARVGFRVSVNDTSDALAAMPAFTISPGESGLTAVRRLLSSVSDRARQGSSNLLNLVGQTPQEPTDYSYGDEHVILSSRYQTRPLAVNKAEIHGKGFYAEAYAWPQVDLLFGRVGKSFDLNVDSSQEAEARAVVELRRSEVAESDGYVTALVQLGQEVYDVVAITDPQVGLDAVQRRVLGVTFTLERYPNSRYDMRLDLGGV